MINEIIQKAREVSGYSQQELSRRLDYRPAPSQISDWETGKRGISLKNFLRICDGSGVKPSEILKKCGL